MSAVIFRILRRALDQGRIVEIDGLGGFRRGESGGYEFVPEVKPRVSVAYVAEDVTPVRRLCESLQSAGCSPWLDCDRSFPVKTGRARSSAPSKSLTCSWRVFPPGPS